MILLALLLACKPEPVDSGEPADPHPVDADADGFNVAVDCDDADATIGAPTAEIPYDGLDQDCDGADLGDLDHDGAAIGEDCDDEDPGRHPDAEELCGDGLDQDCDGVADNRDDDGDGRISAACGGSDPDDSVVETPIPPDSDADGWIDDEDCDAADAGVYPGAPEALDGRDHDCDGELYDFDADKPLYWFPGPCDDADSATSLAAGDLDANGLTELWLGHHGCGQGATVVGFADVLSADIDHPSYEIVLGGGARLLLAIGDLSGDGRDDLAVSPERGAPVYIFTGGANFAPSSAANAAFQVTGAAPSRLYTSDLDGDGAAELLLDDATTEGGAIFYGGVSATSDFSLADVHFPSNPTWNNAADRAPMPLGDLNGDGYPELGLRTGDDPYGEPRRMGVFVGSATPINGEQALDDADAQYYRSDGYSLGDVSCAGDLDGDGFDELVLGSTNLHNGAFPDALYVFAGGPDAASGGFDETQAQSRIVGEVSTSLGEAMLCQDLDGDGLADLLIGAPGWAPSTWASGVVGFVNGPLAPGDTLLTDQPWTEGRGRTALGQAMVAMPGLAVVSAANPLGHYHDAGVLLLFATGAP